jgi:CheY-like chemotaxis protein
VRADIIAARSAATRSADIVRQLLAFARQQSVAPIVVDLNARIAGMFSLLTRLLGEDIQLTSHAEPALWPVRIDPSQLDQILTNLCVNARKAISGVGTIAIATANMVVDAAYCANHALAVPGDYVRLTVTDDGCGMNEETLANIFEPFFTTSVTGEGIGLGLATVFGVVTQNRGFVHVTSTPGHGATFEIFLPRDADAPEATASRAVEPTGDPASKPHKETILLVEDEPALLAIATRMLESNGYQVLRAGGPADALRLVDEHAEHIDLLLTDVIMPGMNGHALASALLLKRPGLRVLYMSGYPSDVIADHGVLVDGLQFLQKPFLISEFIAKVRDTLALS